MHWYMEHYGDNNEDNELATSDSDVESEDSMDADNLPSGSEECYTSSGDSDENEDSDDLSLDWNHATEGDESKMYADNW